MKRKSLLLPHWCQILGWWMLIVCVVAIIIAVIFDAIEIEWNTPLGLPVFVLITCFPYIALILLCLSREKEEDEYIQHIRTRTTFWIVVFGFVMSMIQSSTAPFLSRVLSLDQFGNIYSIVSTIFGIPVLAILYIIIFKTTLLINRVKSRNSEV